MFALRLNGSTQAVLREHPPAAGIRFSASEVGPIYTRQAREEAGQSIVSSYGERCGVVYVAQVYVTDITKLELLDIFSSNIYIFNLYISS